MAPAGSRVFINWFRGSYFIWTYKVNANFRYSRLHFSIGVRLRQRHVPTDLRLDHRQFIVSPSQEKPQHPC